MGKAVLIFLAIHFLGVATYLTVIDEKYCQGEYNPECYEWKGAAGVWEIVMLQELVIRPLIKE